MVNFPNATPRLLHASLFSRKDNIARKHPHASFASAAFHASERRPRPMSGDAQTPKRKARRPRRRMAGFGAAVSMGVRNGCAAGSLMAGAVQEIGRRTRCKELDSGRRLRPSRVGHAGKPRPRPTARDLLPFAGVVQDVERHGVAAGAVAQAFRHAGDGGCRRPRGLLDGSV